MKPEKKDVSGAVRLLAYSLFAYAVCTFLFALYSILQDHVIPFLVNGAESSSVPIIWLYAILGFAWTTIELVLCMLAYTWLMQAQARGWWLSGALFGSWVIASFMGLLQLILVILPNKTLSGSVQGVLLQIGILLVLGITLLLLLFRRPVMSELGVMAGGRALTFGKVAGLGFLLAVLQLVYFMATTSLIAMVFG